MTPVRGRRSQRSSGAPLAAAGALLYALLLIYGTLFPLEGWHRPAVDPIAQMLQYGLARTSWADLVTNILVYMPLGLLLVLALGGSWRCRFCRLAVTVLLGAALSLTLEYLQAHIPTRVPSVTDLLLNTLGTAVGALLGLIFRPDTAIGRHLARWRHLYLAPGPLADIGLGVLALWLLSQIGPLVPSIDLDNLRQGIKPLFKTLQGEVPFQWLKFWHQATAVGALAMIAMAMQRMRHGALGRFALLVAATLALKILIVGRQLSLESVAGALAGLLVAGLAGRRQRPPMVLAMLLLLATVVLDGIRPGPPGSLVRGTFNWIPFRSHLNNDIVGILDILGGVWPFVALAFATLRQGLRQRWVAPLGALGILASSLLLEWYQQGLPGRSADVTDALLAVAAWLAPWFYLDHFRGREEALSAIDDAPPPPRPPSQPLWIAGALTLLAVAALAWIGLQQSPSRHQRETADRLLPPPEALPPVVLPGFRYAHPRLPAPSAADKARMAAGHSKYLGSQLRRAKGGKGPLEAVIVAAYLQPGSQDMARLFDRLMALKPSWRGHREGKLLALGYDWLHDQWSPEQRRRLAKKVVEAADYLIWRIREKQLLSPYNVYLYNSPLQALMATTLATWGDLPEADPPMRWLADYWKNQVLPVWRQVMGRNGGWHEGNEYVGIGIGQAIYQLPAMWRKATGEDLFETPGIRGFNDFLVYRQRPDGTTMRLGDGRFFSRMVPDRAALALETGHKAAYSLRCPRPDQPSAWPWGPLTDDALCDPKAREALPLQRLFDGLGLVVARSDWSRDATYLTFKAGDNYWSHSHLDQGAFTLFKGAALAIDSGYYGPGYGSDHHMNYSYQTIAHNVVTVTDPKDDLPLPSKKRNGQPRPIANDGGQRRVGSGWGRRAPLNLTEWQEERETYHTGRIARYHDQDDLVVAVAELTPAYTNHRSGQGTFADRTFRVRKYWRTLIYDRRNDLVIVHDDLVSADPHFVKRSLIHTLTRPKVSPLGFEVTVPADPKARPPRHAGHLQGWVLFPKGARIQAIGGPGREFWVDGKNYDAGGRIWREVARMRTAQPEPGRWRLEITPSEPAEEDHFLMVLVPGERLAPPLVEPLEGNGGIGVRIDGLERTLIVQFPDDRQGPRIEIQDPEGRRRLDLTLPEAPLMTPKSGLWHRIQSWLGLE